MNTPTQRTTIFVECLAALIGLAAVAPVHAACTTSGASITCTGSNGSQMIPNGISLFDLDSGATLSGSIEHAPASSPVTVNLNGTFNGWLVPGNSDTFNVNVSSPSAYLLTGPRGVASSGNTVNIAAGATINGSNTIGMTGSNSVINVYGHVAGGMTAIITDDYARYGLTNNTTLNLHPGSSVYGAFLPLQPVGEEGFHLNANGSTLTAAHPALPAIRIIGGGPFATSNNGVYYLNDTTLESQLGGIRLAPQTADTTNNNQFTLTGNTRIDSGKYAIIVDGGTGNSFDIQGNTILQGNGGAAINSNGAFDTWQGTPPSVQASDSNRYTLRGNARIIGVTGSAFLGGLGQDHVTLAENAQVTGDIITGDGNDSFTMSGGHLQGKLDMADGDDSALFSHQTDASLTGIIQADGGLGNDMLTFDATTLSSLARFINWETINLNNGANITLDGDLTLGDSASGTGVLNINAGSTLNIGGGNLIIQPASAGQMVQVNNASLINLTAGSSTPGNILTIDGHYSGSNGAIAINTRLGDDSSASDKLVVNGDTAGMSTLRIANHGGSGALTQANGIEVVTVGGNSAGTFKLGNRAVAGIYEYALYQGGVDADANNGNWYLRSLTVPPDDHGGDKPAPRPETGVYLRNMTAASTMFVHTLHDRLCEPQYTDAYRDNAGASVWLRVSGRHSDGQAANGLFDTSNNTTLVHLGGDLARWSSNGDDRWLFGVMGAYGHSDTDVDPVNLKVVPGTAISRTANGRVDGYGAGGYATWYGNHDKPSGPYIDLWGMYGWYHNKVQGNGLPGESYHSEGWTLSAEAGYAFVAYDQNERRQWLIEPQAQLAYNRYDENDHHESNGTWVRNGDADGVIGRIGARLFSHSRLGNNGIQPFVEANWWYNNAKNTIVFNDVALSDGTPDSTYELKAGLQGELARGWQMWGHIGGRWGANSYSSYEGMVGVKHSF